MVGRPVAEATAASLTTRPTSGSLLLVTAVEFESRALARRLGLRGRNGEGFVLRTAAVGASRLPGAGVDWAGVRPSAVLAVGLAGGCAPDIRSGDLILGTRVGPGRDGEWLHPDAALAERARTALAATRLPHRAGPLVTVAAVVATPGAKTECWVRHGALGVDMESAHVLAWARAAGVPGLAVRAVADGPDESLPPALLDVLGPDGAVSPRRLAGWLGRPALLTAAWRAWRRSAAALDHLARFLTAFAAVQP